MRIQRGQQIAGLDAVVLRDYLRYNGHRRIRAENLAEAMRLPLPVATSTLHELVEAGILKCEAGTSFTMDMGGHALAMAKLVKPLPRAKADILLSLVMERAQAINRSDDYLVHVVGIGIFGSYARGADDCGDLDLITECARRAPPSGVSWEDYSKAHFIKHGRVEKNIVSRMTWPLDQAYMALKQRSPHVSLMKDVPPGADARLVYSFDPATRREVIDYSLAQPWPWPSAQ